MLYKCIINDQIDHQNSWESNEKLSLTSLKMGKQSHHGTMVPTATHGTHGHSSNGPFHKAPHRPRGSNLMPPAQEKPMNQSCKVKKLFKRNMMDMWKDAKRRTEACLVSGKWKFAIGTRRIGIIPGQLMRIKTLRRTAQGKLSPHLGEISVISRSPNISI